MITASPCQSWVRMVPGARQFNILGYRRLAFAFNCAAGQRAVRSRYGDRCHQKSPIFQKKYGTQKTFELDRAIASLPTSQPDLSFAVLRC